MRKGIIFFLIILVVSITAVPGKSVLAQDTQEYPTYIVQPGDTLSIISMRFGVSAVDLIDINGITNPDAITAGTPLKIPGLQGISGTLSTKIVQVGENLNSFSMQYHIDKDILIKLNRITSPLEIYAGSSLIIPQNEDQPLFSPDVFLNNTHNLLDIAFQKGINPWTLMRTNKIKGDWSLLNGDALYFNSNSEEIKNNISPLIKEIKITPLPLIQGSTTKITITSVGEVDSVQGTLGSYALNFFKTGDNEFTSLQGINALEETGISQLIISASDKNSSLFTIDQPLIINPGNFGEDPPLEVDPTTIDPAITKPEEDQLKEVSSKASPQRFWSGPFLWPTDEPCIKSWFGNRRIYNDTLRSFHTGVDLGVCANNLNIYAAAPGVVVFAGPLSIRGNSTIIDHGWGVYSGYWHQKELLVKVGDTVEAHQQIGIIGDTGRVTGPHLHWEVRVGNVQVNPIEWIENTFP